MNFIMDIWNTVTGAPLVEPAFWMYIAFTLMFIVIPICVAILTIKVILFLGSCIFGD